MRHSIDYTQSFGIKLWVHGFHDIGFTNASILVHYELHDDTAVNLLILCFLWVLDILLEILHQPVHTSGELGVFLYHVVDFIFLIVDFIFPNFYGHIVGDLHELSLVLSQYDSCFFNLGITLYDIEYLDRCYCFGRGRR